MMPIKANKYLGLLNFLKSVFVKVCMCARARARACARVCVL